MRAKRRRLPFIVAGVVLMVLAAAVYAGLKWAGPQIARSYAGGGTGAAQDYPVTSSTASVVQVIVTTRDPSTAQQSAPKQVTLYGDAASQTQASLNRSSTTSDKGSFTCSLLGNGPQYSYHLTFYAGDVMIETAYLAFGGCSWQLTGSTGDTAYRPDPTYDLLRVFYRDSNGQFPVPAVILTHPAAG